MNFSWKCPFCNHHTTILNSNTVSNDNPLHIPNKQGNKNLITQWIVCPNKDCKELSLIVHLYEHKYKSDGLRGDWNNESHNKTWNLIPTSTAKIFPGYIPKAIIQDYQEACLILDLSPKASATLSRRCLQGMIRDFWKINENTLFEEINAIQDKVDALTWKSIDSVRQIGNIGAHMEKDINLIIDVDPNEANLLIHLIEDLINDWYINKHERERKLKEIIELGTKKKEEKKAQ